MMQLQNAIRHGQADPAALALGREVQIENLVADLVRNAGPFVRDAQDGILLVLFEHHPQPASLRHGLCPILNDIEDRLLEQVGIHVRDQGIRRQAALQRHVAG